MKNHGTKKEWRGQPSLRRSTDLARMRPGISFVTRSALLTSHFSLPTSHFPLLTSHFSLLTSHFSLLTSPFSLLTSHFSLLTSHFSLLTSHFSLLTSHFSLLTSHFSLRAQRLHSVMPSKWVLEQTGLLARSGTDIMNHTRHPVSIKSITHDHDVRQAPSHSAGH